MNSTDSFGSCSSVSAIQLVSMSAALAIEPATVFSTECNNCHTYIKGDRVAPDLKGATDRHPRSWLVV